MSAGGDPSEMNGSGLAGTDAMSQSRAGVQGQSQRKNRLDIVSDDEDNGNQGSQVNVAFEPDGGGVPAVRKTTASINNNVSSNGAGGSGNGREFHTYMEEVVTIPEANSSVKLHNMQFLLLFISVLSQRAIFNLFKKNYSIFSN